jgi:hypothetical protein
LGVLSARLIELARVVEAGEAAANGEDPIAKAATTPDEPWQAV